MLCSHEKKFIYLKTRKAAGTSLEVFFERFCVPQGQYRESHFRNQQITEAGIVGARSADRFSKRPKYYHHMPAAELREKIGREMFDGFYKFCAMRNPFDKVVSHFWWRARQIGDLSDESFPRIKERFTDFVLQRSGAFNDRSIFMIDGRSVVDDFIRYECLAADAERVCNRLGVSFDAKLLGTYKSGARKRQEHFSQYYSSVTRRLVAREFAWELNRFGYSL
jgi:hypothetical protein